MSELLNSDQSKIFSLRRAFNSHKNLLVGKSYQLHCGDEEPETWFLHNKMPSITQKRGSQGGQNLGFLAVSPGFSSTMRKTGQIVCCFVINLVFKISICSNEIDTYRNSVI